MTSFVFHGRNHFRNHEGESDTRAHIFLLLEDTVLGMKTLNGTCSLWAQCRELLCSSEPVLCVNQSSSRTRTRDSNLPWLYCLKKERLSITAIGTHMKCLIFLCLTPADGQSLRVTALLYQLVTALHHGLQLSFITGDA